jgi:hypothetical protein
MSGISALSRRRSCSRIGTSSARETPAAML